MSAYTAELLPPLLSLNLGGKIMFKKGVAVPVDLAFAQKLAENPRFHVTGLHSRTALEEAAYHARPKGEALLQAIRDACDKFDEDDDDHWDRSGKHSVNALSKALGYAVSAVERDRALGHEEPAPASLPVVKEVSEDAVTGPGPAPGRLEAADGKVETNRPLTIKLKPKAAAAVALADIVEPDPSTDGAIAG